MGTPASKDFKHLFEQVRRVATAKGRADTGLFAAEGRRLLERALRAGWVPSSVLLGQEAAQTAELSTMLAQWPALAHTIQLVPDRALLELAGGRHAGLVTTLFQLPAGMALSQLLAQPPPAVFLVVVDVTEPGNVGALIRTALACGAAGVICVGATDPFHPKAVRTSLGSTFKLPLARAAAEELLPQLRGAGIHTLAAVAREGAALHEAAWPAGSAAVLVGNESQGLGEHWRQGADTRVSIDLSRAADSFCVNAAAAICLYEVQRRLVGAADCHASAEGSVRTSENAP